MSEVLRDLVVTLSLQSDNFSRNINSINRQIREAESAFRLAGAGVQNYSQTTDGMANRLSMLNTNLGRQREAVSQYERALAQANARLQESHSRYADYSGRSFFHSCRPGMGVMAWHGHLSYIVYIFCHHLVSLD